MSLKRNVCRSLKYFLILFSIIGCGAGASFPGIPGSLGSIIPVTGTSSDQAPIIITDDGHFVRPPVSWPTADDQSAGPDITYQGITN